MKKIFALLIAVALVIGGVCVFAVDINGDGELNVFDVVTLRSYIVNGEVLSESKFEMADVTGDGHVDITDVVVIRSFIVNGIPDDSETGGSVTGGGDTEQTDTSATSTTTTTTTTTTTATTVTTAATTQATVVAGSGQSKLDNYKTEVLRLVNAEREKVGLEPLLYSDELEEFALIRASEITEKFSHTRPNGEAWFEMLYDSDLNWYAIGENIAAGYETPQQVVRAWMNSEGHRENILDPNYTHMAIGYKETGSGYYYYWAQWFANFG